MMLRLGHCALAQDEPVVEQAGMIDTVSVADQGVGQSAQVKQSVSIGVVAGEPRHLEPEQESDLPESHFGGHSRETAASFGGGAREAEVLIDDRDLVGIPPEIRARSARAY